MTSTLDEMAAEEDAGRDNPISFRATKAYPDLIARIDQVADETDRSRNYVMNKVLHEGLPPLRSEP